MIERVEQWVRWPLWSWRNLAVTTVAVLVLFTAVGRLTTTAAAGSGAPRPVETVPVAVPDASTATGIPVPPATPAPTAMPAPTGMPAPTASARPSPTTTPGGSAGTGPSDPTAAAVAFVTEWTRGTTDQAAWLETLKPLTTAEYQASLATVDPARVPARKALDKGRLLSTSGSRSLVQVATDGGAMTVTLALRDGSWLVADIEPANQPPGAPTPALTARPTGTG